MTNSIENGTKREVDGRLCVYYDGYWIRSYTPPQESLAARQTLIFHLTRRTFHHTEAGINTPGEKLGAARHAYDNESDPAHKRVKGAMLAGALFNRVTDIFTSVVELAKHGVVVDYDNELMRQCNDYLTEAMELGKTVKHFSGQEGIDELWGEPLKAFTMSLEEFYNSRYIKISQTIRNIDRVTKAMAESVEHLAPFNGIELLINEFKEAAILECETMKSDPVIFEIWPRFVAAGEALLAFSPAIPRGQTETYAYYLRDGTRLLRDGKNLLAYIAGARVPMPKSTAEFLSTCQDYAESGRCLKAAS